VDKKPVNKNVFRIKEARRLPLPTPTLSFWVLDRNDNIVVLM